MDPQFWFISFLKLARMGGRQQVTGKAARFELRASRLISGLLGCPNALHRRRKAFSAIHPPVD